MMPPRFLTRAWPDVKDSHIAVICRSGARILVTLDNDFSNIPAYPPEDYPGLIVIHSEDQSKPVVLSLLRRVVRALKEERIYRSMEDCGGNAIPCSQYERKTSSADVSASVESRSNVRHSTHIAAETSQALHRGFSPA